MENFLKMFDETTGVSTDTRNIHEGSMFIALKGENFNGNTFAKQAIEKGSKYAIVDEEGIADGKEIFFVDNALIFLQKLARAHRDRVDIPVIGITGSNGKTTSKELINCVLQKKFQVLCTKGNLNNHIGVPLTILGLKKQHQIAIIEMGANGLGEIAELCQISNPTYGLITNIGKAHLEGFKNFEGVFNTKTALYEHVMKNDGILFYNEDDQILTDFVTNYQKRISFGMQNTFIQGSISNMNPFVSFEWKTVKSPEVQHVQSKLTGKYNFYNFLSAIAIGSFFEVVNKDINEALADYIPDNKRSEVRITPNNTLIIDCYNANPSSMSLALESFKQMDAKSSLAILGDMKELGEESHKEHMEIIKQCHSLGLRFYTIGNEFKKVYSEGFDSTMEFKEFLKNNPFKGFTILLKGSRGMALENLISLL